MNNNNFSSSNNLISRNQSVNYSLNNNSNDRSFKMNQNKSYLNKYTKVFQGTEEWNQLEYQFQLKCNLMNVKLSHIYNVNQDKENNFGSKHEGKIILDSWNFIQDLDQENKIEELLERGQFNFNKQGLLFRTGFIDLKDLVLSNEKQTFEILVCEISPGKCQIEKILINEDDNENIKNLKQLQSVPLNPIFDSFYIQRLKPKQEDQPKDEEDEQDQNYWEYILFKKDDVNLKYVLRVDLDIDMIDRNYVKMCSMCDIQLAAKFCMNDQVYLCLECDQIDHEPLNINRHTYIHIYIYIYLLIMIKLYNLYNKRILEHRTRFR